MEVGVPVALLKPLALAVRLGAMLSLKLVGCETSSLFLCPTGAERERRVMLQALKAEALGN